MPRAPAPLDAAPGPCPWYFGPDRPPITGRVGAYRWEKIADAAGCVSLHRSDGTPVLVIGMYGYVKPLAPPRFVAWYPADAGSGRDLLSVHLFDADELGPVADVVSASNLLDRTRRLVTTSRPLASFDVPLSLAPGPHPLSVPDAFADVGELLLLGNSSAREVTDDPQAENSRCIYAVEPATGRVSVYPQDWFNRGGYDPGYCWITRVARDPADGRIVGDGIRIGSFVLDETNRDTAPGR